MKKFKDVAYVTLGAFLLAISINSLLLPNHLVAGGANGISIIINKLFQVPLAVTLYAINIPLLILCFVMLGKEVGMKTIYGSMLYPFFVAIVGHFPVFTHNQLLGAIFGGIITGIGLGLVFKGNASTGGTAIISQIVHEYVKIPMGLAVSLVDGLVILSAFIAFDTDTVFYSLICLFVIGRVIDLVQVGLGISKNVFIISSETLEIKDMIHHNINRGLSVIPIEGGYQKEHKEMIMCVLPEKEFQQVKTKVLSIDPEAFVIATAASDVMGRGFSLNRLTT